MPTGATFSIPMTARPTAPASSTGRAAPAAPPRTTLPTCSPATGTAGDARMLGRCRPPSALSASSASSSPSMPSGARSYSPRCESALEPTALRAAPVRKQRTGPPGGRAAPAARPVRAVPRRGQRGRVVAVENERGRLVERGAFARRILDEGTRRCGGGRVRDALQKVRLPGDRAQAGRLGRYTFWPPLATNRTTTPSDASTGVSTAVARSDNNGAVNLPSGYAQRAACTADLPAIERLLADCDAAESEPSYDGLEREIGRVIESDAPRRTGEALVVADARRQLVACTAFRLPAYPRPIAFARLL